MTEEDFGPAAEACSKQGQFTIASLKGSYNGEAWRSTPANPFRLQVVGKWSPYAQEGSRPVGGPYPPLANFCSAHYFDVDGSLVTYAWYGEGTRFLDISDPANPRQVAYWRPDNGIVWASYNYKGYIYTADRTRGVDILKLTGGAKAAARVQARGRRARAVGQAAALPGRAVDELGRRSRHRRALPASRRLMRRRGAAAARPLVDRAPLALRAKPGDVAMFDATVTTTCGSCGVGCRLEAYGDDEAGARECMS